jgi:ABC-type nickel/cobalt efflux system permease component RcnA
MTITLTVTSVIFLLLLVSRSKLVPDFAVTVHILHLIITSLYSHSLPTNWLWWALQVASAALMTSLGVWACQYRELRPISFGGVGSRQTNANNNGGDEENQDGFAMGRGRGRNRDGGGNYEMVAMKEGADEGV